MNICKLATLACLITASAAPQVKREAGAAECGVRIIQRARALQPGEVVLLTIVSPAPQSQVEAAVFEKKFPFSAGKDGTTWTGLVGIDLEAKEGAYTVKIRLTDPLGRVRECDHPIRIRPKSFPTRSLMVDEKFVTPPQEVQGRIEEEGKRVAAIFAQVGEQRHWRGGFTAPVSGPMISAFGKRNIMNGKPRSPHSGVDFDAEEGTPITAPNGGRVVLAEDLYFSGNTVIVDHGQGLYSLFAHLSRFSVKNGDRVARGDVIGRVGATGRVTGPHLHWSVRLVGTRVDPLSLISASRDSSTVKAEKAATSRP